MANRKSERRTSPSKTTRRTRSRNGAACPSDLAALLAPHDPNDFLANVYARTFRHYPGTKGRLSGLLPWDALNAILNGEPLGSPRLRLYQNGKQLDPSTYENRSCTKAPFEPRIDAASFERALDAGATLILDSIDRSYAPLRDLCADLERVFRTDVAANLYAAWGTDNGFDFHWDPQETLILQLSGRKRWTVYDPTIPFPLEPMHAPHAHRPGPGVRPIFDEVLEDGDILHVPRGFWHLPRAVGEPSMHLTVTMVPITGRDLLSWIARKAIAHPAVRQHVPALASEEERAEWMRAIREAFLSTAGGDVLERFLADRDGSAPLRPRLALPRTTPRKATHPSTRVRLAAPRSLRLRPEADGRVSFECGGHRWKTTPLARPMLETLADRRPHALGELLGASDDVALRDLVDALVADRVLEVVEG